LLQLGLAERHDDGVGARGRQLLHDPRGQLRSGRRGRSERRYRHAHGGGRNEQRDDATAAATLLRAPPRRHRRLSPRRRHFRDRALLFALAARRLDGCSIAIPTYDATSRGDSWCKEPGLVWPVSYPARDWGRRPPVWQAAKTARDHGVAVIREAAGGFSYHGSVRHPSDPGALN